MDDFTIDTTIQPVNATATIDGYVDELQQPTSTIPVVANADVGNPITDLSEARTRRLARRRQRERDRVLLIALAAIVVLVVVL
jgi:hypothetical protein